jgi:hypothetical protein
MLDVPAWLVEIIREDGFKCPSCHFVFSQEGVVAVGIKAGVRNATKTVVFAEYMCPKCSQISRLELQEMSVAQFAGSIIDDMENQIMDEIELEQQKKMDHKNKQKDTGKNLPKAKKKSDKSGITKKEQCRIVKEMNNDNKGLSVFDIGPRFINSPNQRPDRFRLPDMEEDIVDGEQ